MAPSSIEFNPLVVIAGAAVLCAIISFIVARRNIRARPVFAQDARGGEEKPPLADVYIEPMRGLGWKEMMVCSELTASDQLSLLCSLFQFPRLTSRSLNL